MLTIQMLHRGDDRQHRQQDRQRPRVYVRSDTGSPWEALLTMLTIPPGDPRRDRQQD